MNAEGKTGDFMGLRNVTIIPKTFEQLFAFEKSYPPRFLPFGNRHANTPWQSSTKEH